MYLVGYKKGACYGNYPAIRIPPGIWLQGWRNLFMWEKKQWFQ